MLMSAPTAGFNQDVMPVTATSITLPVGCIHVNTKKMGKRMNRMTKQGFAIHAVAMSFLGLFVLPEGSFAQSVPHAPPQGIYAKIDISDYIAKHKLMDQGDNDAFASLYDSVLKNDANSGLTLAVHWRWAEPLSPILTGPVFNWGYVDVAFDRATFWHKTIQLIVTAGFNSPQWVLDSIPSCDLLFSGGNAPNCGTATFNYYSEKTDQDGPNDTLVLPLPWNLTYISKWHAFLAALEQRYGSDSHLVSISMAGPTAASAEIILPNNFNTCPKKDVGPCQQKNGLTAEQMWNVLFQNTSSDPGQPYPTNSDKAFIDQWKYMIEFYEALFSQITLVITPGAGTGLPSFASGYPFTASTGNVLYHPECDYSDTGGYTYVKSNFATRSCDAVTTILSYFMNTFGGHSGDLMASQTSGMTASTPLELGPYVAGGDTGDVAVPGLKYLSWYSGFPGSGPRGIASGEQFDYPFSGRTEQGEQQEGCWRGQKSCQINPTQAAYNVLKNFFYGTTGATPFGGPAVVGGSSLPTPRFLQVYNQDVTYAQNPTSCAVLIRDPVTNATFIASAQDLLNAAKASLFGQTVTFPPPHAGC
jgi:hypothetical protein